MSFYRLLYHIVFSTKYRKPHITADIERDVYNTLYHQLLKYNCFVHRIGGHTDHVHILVEIPPTVALSELIKITKQESSKEIRQRNIRMDWAGWEEGYGAFTYAKSDIETIKTYICNQKRHHSTISFLDEYRDWLIQQGIDPNHPYFPHESTATTNN